MAEVPLRSLERYDVLDRIAVGGMAEVFLAKAYGAHGFEKTLAIKRILPELARDPEFEERFIAEAKMAVRLSHTNVVQVFDFGRFAGSLFIAMEYVDGLDLAALLRRHKDLGRLLPVPAAFHIAVELARGLDFAHQHGVVHRDVSPSNILLSRAGEVKIADFGIAVAARPDKPKPGAKRKVMGKWRYMSPEQARGESLDPRSDIFSMAVVMYELLTGEKLFPGDEVEDIVRNINDMPLPRPSEIRRDLPKRVDEILLPALSREPSRRPLRAAVLQRAMTELSYESSIVATALDVADAVSNAMDSVTPTSVSTSGKHSLDSIIRATLADNVGKDGETRRTALQTGQTADKSTALTASKLYRDRGTGEPLVITREAIILGGANTVEAEGGAEPVEKDRVTEPVQLQNLGGDETTGAVLERRIDPDGITHLEFDDKTIAAIPRAKRGDTSGQAIVDPLAHPERGREAAESKGPLPDQGPGPRRGWLLGVLAFLALGSGALWLATRGGTTTAAADAGITQPTRDATLPIQTGAILVIESTPPGATGTVGDLPIPATPSEVIVPAGVKLTVTLDLAGYRTWTDDGVVAERGQEVRIRADLVRARAELHVRTEPPGATVTLGGKLIGETPLDRTDLDPRRGVEVAIARAGYETVRRRVDLDIEAPVKLDETLVAIQRFGTIDIQFKGGEGWAEVYLKRTKIATAPQQGIRLPVGKHRLELVNPPSGKRWSLTVNVVDGENVAYTTQLP